MIYYKHVQNVYIFHIDISCNKRLKDNDLVIIPFHSGNIMVSPFLQSK